MTKYKSTIQHEIMATLLRQFTLNRGLFSITQHHVSWPAKRLSTIMILANVSELTLAVTSNTQIFKNNHRSVSKPHCNVTNLTCYRLLVSCMVGITCKHATFHQTADVVMIASYVR